jgi:hypothetical protein
MRRIGSAGGPVKVGPWGTALQVRRDWHVCRSPVRRDRHVCGSSVRSLRRVHATKLPPLVMHKTSGLPSRAAHLLRRDMQHRQSRMVVVVLHLLAREWMELLTDARLSPH